jgi:hypothetical protein
MKWTGGEFIAARFVLRADLAPWRTSPAGPTTSKFPIPDAAEE